MRGFLVFFLVVLSVSVSNTQHSIHPLDSQNKLFIITLDGFRWQEIFNGADLHLLNDPKFTSDTSFSKALYWDSNTTTRRKKLLPFLWSIVGEKGQLHGNRAYKNYVNVSNPYKLSYPGYSELLTGAVDFSITGNHRKKNRNKNILQELNSSSSYAGKVAAFTSWDVFPFILDEEKSDFVINSGFQNIEGKNLTAAERKVNAIQTNVIENKAATRYDELTFITCKEYILKKKPSVVFFKL